MPDDCANELEAYFRTACESIRFSTNVLLYKANPFEITTGTGFWTWGPTETRTESISMPIAPSDPVGHFIPTFIKYSESCGLQGPAQNWGEKEISFDFRVMREQGPNICFNKIANSYHEVIRNGLMQLQNYVAEKIINDYRYVLHSEAGAKASVIGGRDVQSSVIVQPFSQNVPYPATPADNYPSFDWLERLIGVLHTNYNVMPRPAGRDSQSGRAYPPHFTLIAGESLISALNRELGVVEANHFLASGGDKQGIDFIKTLGVTQTGPYRGIAFMTDPFELRFSAYPPGGVLNDTTVKSIIVSPYTAESGANGSTVRGAINPNYANPDTAPFAAALLVGGDRPSFERLVPKGPETFKLVAAPGGSKDVEAPTVTFPSRFAKVTSMNWWIPQDACNQYQDYGWHNFEIARAWRPVAPHFICSIIFRRTFCAPVLPNCSASDETPVLIG